MGDEEPFVVMGEGDVKPWLKSPFILVSNVFENRNLLKHLIGRDFKNTYHGHILGYTWSMLEPLLFTGIFYMVLIILRNSPDNLMPLKIMLGILMYSAFSRTAQACTLSLTRNSALIQQIYFPREIILVAISGFQSIRLALSLIIVVPYMIYASLAPTSFLLLLPLAAVSAVLFGQGIGMLLVIVHVRFRDTEQILALIIRAGFYLSGVFYGAEHVPTEWLEIFFLNPIAVFIEMGRCAIFGDIGVLEVRHITRAVIVSLATFYLGSIVFMRNERKAVLHL